MSGRRILCLTFGELKTDLLARGAPGLRPDPVVAIEPRGSALGVAAANAAARALGVRAGMTLTEARARLPGLHAAALGPGEEAAALARLAAWAVRWGPAIGIVPGGEGRPPGVAVEVGGSAHLFGGEAALAGRAVEALERGGFAARAAVAGTLGVAYAVSAAGARAAGPCEPAAEGASGVVPPGGEAAALADLPVSALRLEPAVVGRLSRLGIRTVAGLAALDRASVAHRFGAAAVRRLAQALGEVAEPIEPFRPPEAFRARLEFPEPSELPETLLFALRRLLDDAGAWLLARGEGARRLVLGIESEDAAPGAAVAAGGRRRMDVEVGLLAPRRDPRRLLGLLRERLAAVPSPGRVEAIELAVSETAPLRARQLEAFAAGGTAPREPVAELFERLVARLGEEGVLRAEQVPDARPERAYRLEPATRAPPPAPATAGAPLGPGACRLATVRPVRIFDPPRPVTGSAAPQGMRLLRGPERIEAGWWDGAGAARDYHEVEDGEGRRYWAFRSEGRWMLHGSFA